MNDQGGVDLSGFLTGFVAEADEHLGLASKNLLLLDAALKSGQAHPRAVRELYRSLHTIKGLAAMMGYEPIVAIAHAMESLLRVGDRAGGVLHPTAPDALVRGLRALEQRIAVLASAKGELAPAPEDLLELLSTIPASGHEHEHGGGADAVGSKLGLASEIAARLSESERAQLIAAGAGALCIDFAPSPERSAAGTDITSVRERLGALGDIVKVVPLSRPVSAETPGGLLFAVLAISAASDDQLALGLGLPPSALHRLASAPAGIAGAAARPEAEPHPETWFDEGAARRGVVRVEVARLDDALEKLSALLVTRARLGRALGNLHDRGGDVRELAAIVQESGRQLRDLRGAIMRARMVSAVEMLERLPLLVRGLSRSTGKQVALELDAGRTELDKSVAERIFPALVHLIRNAVDHAIEPPDVRQREGKPTRGTLLVRCRETANNQVELTVSDDGQGIDVQGLARRAGHALPASEDALLNLMSLPGISTLAQATATSGRGMGMNIVKGVVEELGGQISVETAAKRGTTFVLRLPLSITIVDAFSFRSGRQVFVVPVSAVEEIAEVDPARITVAPSGKNRAALRMLERHGVAIPLVSLETYFHLEPLPCLLRKAIVVRRNGQPFGFEVDQMLGHQEVVVRPLQDPLVRQPGIVGSTDLGDGQPTLVLDLISLSARLSRRRTDLRS